MNETCCVSIREAKANDLQRLEPLWEALYDHQREHGLLSSLSPDGFMRWRQALAPVLGRFGCLFLAETEEELVGFLAGRIRTPTPPFAATPVGFISEVFVRPEHRGSGTGRELLRQATEWIAQQGVTRLELQVLSGNTQARQIYEYLGWREELVQMVFLISPGSVTKSLPDDQKK
jgi:ribosomal protein S18 acetylase RimI-like enzyme